MAEVPDSYLPQIAYQAELETLSKEKYPQFFQKESFVT